MFPIFTTSWIPFVSLLLAMSLPREENVAHWMHQAKSHLEAQETNQAFHAASHVYSLDPNTRGLSSLLESCFQQRINTAKDDDMDARVGLSSLLMDQERFEEASVQLRQVIHQYHQLDEKNNRNALEMAQSKLFRAQMATCRWNSYEKDSAALVSSLRLLDRLEDKDGGGTRDVPAVHPFEALKWPCIDIKSASLIASLYARRSVASTVTDETMAIRETNDIANEIKSIISTKRVTATASTQPTKSHNDKKIRIGYITADFTARHPLAFLMQDYFSYHDKDNFEIFMYSLAHWCDSPEVTSLRQASDTFRTFPAGEAPHVLAGIIQQDSIDVLVDLTGYTGLSLLSEILSLRPAPLQICHMGFPGSLGAPYYDYLIVDKTVVPPSLRNFYTEGLLFMPDSYFCNSHKTCASHLQVTTLEQRHMLREQCGLPQDAFVFCCHNRPDKMDPYTFQTWLQAIARIQQSSNRPVALWLLRSGPVMEENLCRVAFENFGPSVANSLVFCDVVQRDQHLHRLGCADLFLDTPAYNAHTLGVDSLFAGVPMVSLLRPDDGKPDGRGGHVGDGAYAVDTQKMASRVGASLLQASGLGDDLVCDSMQDYEDTMVRCATDNVWFDKLRKHLRNHKDTNPLFDMERWVRNLEAALVLAVDEEGTSTFREKRKPDIHVQETSKNT